MKATIFRFVILVWLLNTLAIIAVLMISPTMPRNIGTLGFDSMSRLGAHFYYYDSMTGLQNVGSAPLDDVQLALPDSYLEDGQRVIVIENVNQAPRVIGRYPLQPRYISLVWGTYNETIILTHLADDGTHLSRLDTETGMISEFQTVTDFYANYFEQSPDGNYLLMRQDDVRLPLVTTPQRHRIVDLRTGEIIAVPDTLYAHWSPNSQALLIGVPTDSPLQVTVEIYDILTAHQIDLGMTVNQRNVPFLQSVDDSETAILWASDSQSVMVYSDVQERLMHISLDGDILLQIDAARLFPTKWSLDSRYMVATGTYDNQTGAFIVNPITETLQHLAIDQTMIPSLTDFEWTANSQYLAVLIRTIGGAQRTQPIMLIIYNQEGEQIAQPALQLIPETQYFRRHALRWMSP